LPGFPSLVQSPRARNGVTKPAKVSFGLLTSGIALSLVMATVIRAVGVHFGIEPWAQVAGAGVSCYVGPDPILKAIAGIALKRFGVSEDAKNGRGNP
jgi:hypothetical protein